MAVKAAGVDMRLVVAMVWVLRNLAAVTGGKLCRGSPSSCRPALQRGEPLVCVTRGHFAHPDSPLRFYKCHHPGTTACDCACPYAEMCFDVHAARCRFSFLPEVNNCTGIHSTTQTTPVTPASTATATTTPAGTASSGVAQKNGSLFKKTRMYDLKYRFQHGIHRNVTFESSRASGFDLVGHDGLSAPERGLVGRVGGVGNEGRMGRAVSGKAIFPTWAVAVLVLCVVLLLVLMVVFLY